MIIDNMSIDYKIFTVSKNPNRKLPSWDSCIKKIRIGNTADSAYLYYLGPGRQSDDYSTKLSNFNWDSFYSKFSGGRFIEYLKQEFCKNYDYILVDSRTGLADTAGICTIHLPHALVAVLTPSPKGYDLLGDTIKIIRERHKSFFRDTAPNLSIIPLPTRHDDSETVLLEKWKNKMLRGYVSFYLKKINGRKSDISADLSKIELLYVPWCTYLDDLESHKEPNIDVLTSNTLRYKNLINFIEKAIRNEKIQFAYKYDNNQPFIENIESNILSYISSSKTDNIFYNIKKQTVPAGSHNEIILE